MARPKTSLLTFTRRERDADVLFVTNMWPRPDKQAYGVFVQRQIESLIEAGLRCDVLVVHGHRSQLAYLFAGLRLLSWNFHPRHRYRLVHAHGGETVPFARAYLRAPLVASYCGDDVNGTPDENGRVRRRFRVKSWALRQAGHLAQATITKSRPMQDRLPARLARRNSVVPNGVDQRVFKPVDRDEARARLGWSPHERVVLFAADPAVARKRWWLADAATKAAAVRDPRIRIRVANQLPPHEMPMMMSAADCLLLTSASEGSSNVVKEALAVNLPVVSTPAGDVEHLLDGVEPSSLCTSEPESLALGLLRCTEHPVRSNGREASAWLDSRTIAERVLTIYASLYARTEASNSV